MTGAAMQRPAGRDPVLRIAYVLARPTGVSETFIDAEVRAVRAAGAAVDVFPAIEAGRGRAGLLARAVARHPVRLVRGVRTLGFSYGLRGLLAAAAAIRLLPQVRAARPDVVHAHFVNLPAAVAVLLARDLGVPVTATAHAADFLLDARRTALRRRLLSLSHLFVISAATADQLADRGVPMTRVPHGVVRAAFDGVMAPRPGAPGAPATRLVTVARLVGKKGVDTAIEAVARLAAAGRDVTYDVYGDGPLRASLERLAAERGVGTAVTFHGAVPHATAVGALSGADVAVLPCRRDTGGDLDGIPVFLMEAASRHVPVVTTAVSGIPELVDENSGRLVPPDDAAALAQAIEDVIDHPQRAAHRAQLLAERVATEFSPQLQARRLLETWQRLARPGDPATAPADLTVVCSFFPLPADRGDPVRVLMMLRALARVRAYTMLVVRRADTTAELVDELRELLPGVRVEDFPATPYRLDRLGPAGRFPEALAVGMPPWVRTRYSRPLHERLQARSGLGLAIGEAAGAYFAGTRLRWHWDKANVLADSTRHDLAEASGVADHLRARYLVTTSTRFEARALAHCDTVSVTSEAEAARLQRRHGRTAGFTLASCVPIPAGHTPRPAARTLVWLGSFAYRSNLLGLRRFLAEGWPPLRRAGYTVTLVGSGLTDPLRAELAAYDGVTVAGYVEDLRPVLSRSSAAVVPLWSGAGVKLKTLTLLAHSVPVFTTTTGAEGVPATTAVRIADTPATLAEAILRTSPAELDAMAVEGPRLIRAELSEERFADRLIRSLAGCGYLDPAGTPAAEGR